MRRNILTRSQRLPRLLSLFFDVWKRDMDVVVWIGDGVFVVMW